MISRRGGGGKRRLSRALLLIGLRHLDIAAGEPSAFVATGIQFQGNGIRVIIDEKGDPWWIGHEVCGMLGPKIPMTP